jgi:hypothetical protein
MSKRKPARTRKLRSASRVRSKASRGRIAILSNPLASRFSTTGAGRLLAARLFLQRLQRLAQRVDAGADRCKYGLALGASGRYSPSAALIALCRWSSVRIGLSGDLLIWFRTKRNWPSSMPQTNFRA